MEQPTNVTFKTESVILTSAQVMAHQCNCTDQQARGLTKKVFELWPDANTYATREKTGPHLAGTCSLHTSTSMRPNVMVANLYVQTRAGPANSEEEWQNRRRALTDSLEELF